MRWKVEHLSAPMTAAYWVDMMVVRRAEHSAVMTADSKADSTVERTADSKAVYLVEMTAVMTAG